MRRSKFGETQESLRYHPITGGKIERHHRPLKNVMSLDQTADTFPSDDGLG